MPTVDLTWWLVRVGDFDGDGRSDVFWRNRSTGANSIWKSANHLTPQATASVPDQYWLPAAAGDFNGDGKSDIFWHKFYTGENVIWLSGNAATRQLVQKMSGGRGRWEVVGSGDFDGDSKVDVFWRNFGIGDSRGTGANVIWKSANAATPQAVHGVFDPAWRVMPTEETLVIFF